MFEIIIIIIAIIIFLSVAGAYIGMEFKRASDSKKEINAELKAINERTEANRKQHDNNMAYLKNINFQINQSRAIAGRSFYFDYTKRLTAYEEENHVNVNLYSCGSFISEIKVFPDDKIVECVLLQDGAVVKKSEGSAILAGLSIPYFGSVQGTASTGSSEREMGILSVRLTLNDLQTPTVVFNVISGADKSSVEYGRAFAGAQELFGFFDGIARLNLKVLENVNSQSESASLAIDSQPPAVKTESNTTDLKETVFEKIRQLAKLRDEGLLTEEEFNAKKQVLIDQI